MELTLKPSTLKDQSSVLVRRQFPLDDNEEQPLLDMPQHSNVLTTEVEKYAAPIRQAVSVLSSSFEKTSCTTLRRSQLSPSCGRSVSGMVMRTEAEIAAWTLTSVWVIGVAVRALPASSGLIEAEAWFTAGSSDERMTNFLSEQAISQAECSLQANLDGAAYLKMLPYILDPHGPGNRLSVRRDPATHVVRKRKREGGVFYTPSDVAEYMVGSCLDSINDITVPTVFDPACGTGVFLRASLKALRHRYPHKNAFSLASECLFGTDVDPWMLDASAFVMLSDIWDETKTHQMSPLEAWRKLRSSLKCIDALLIDLASENVGSTVEQIAGRVSLCNIFPRLNKGPTVIVGNPPYTSMSDFAGIRNIWQVFKTLRSKRPLSVKIYLVFIEQMIRLANQGGCAGSLVLPLSVASNIGAQFVATRMLMQETPGHWKFAFFDREPHALFGEDVKTRNAIILWSGGASYKQSEFASGPLRKWRSNNRPKMFESIRFTNIDGNIESGIPKIEGSNQARALHILSARKDHLKRAIQGVERLSLAAAGNVDDRTVLVGPTAYNFLNVFLRPTPYMLQDGVTLSQNPLHAIQCSSPDDAFVVFGLLTSHLAYWWWRTHGDGFHVSRRFILEFPFGSEVLGGEKAGTLSACGASLWSAIRSRPVSSVNRGRTSFSYTTNDYDNLRRGVDEIMVDVAGLNNGFVNELQRFTSSTIAARF